MSSQTDSRKSVKLAGQLNKLSYDQNSDYGVKKQNALILQANYSQSSSDEDMKRGFDRIQPKSVMSHLRHKTQIQSLENVKTQKAESAFSDVVATDN